MKGYISKRFFVFASLVLGIVLVLAIIGLTGAQQIPGLDKLTGGLKASGVAKGFGGLEGLNTAKELFGQKDRASYPTPNIAVSGNNIVIAWPNGVVTVENIADDGSLHRTVLGPPSDSNVGETGKK